MMYKCHPIQYYDFSSADRLLLDTNIWLYIYGHTGQTIPKKMGIYSHAFKRMLEAQSRIYIDTLTVSEFINAYTKTAWSQEYREIYADFKDFRGSLEFKPIAEEIAAKVRRIMKLCHFVSSCMQLSEVTHFVDEYAKGDSDFNDQIFVRICQSSHLTLVTHDGDFLNQNITLISGNRRLMI